MTSVAICMVGELRTILHTSSLFKKNVLSVYPNSKTFLITKDDWMNLNFDVFRFVKVKSQRDIDRCHAQVEYQKQCLIEIEKSGIHFQVIFKMRPDLVVMTPMPSIDILSKYDDSVLLPPFIEDGPFGDDNRCFLHPYSACLGHEIRRSRHLYTDQFAVIPFHLRNYYLNRTVLSWTVSGPRHLQTEFCRFHGKEFLRGCECELFYSLRNIKTIVFPFFVTLQRSRYLHKQYEVNRVMEMKRHAGHYDVQDGL